MSDAPTLTIGGVLPLRVTLGVGDSADRAPATGNDLVTRWREDLPLLAELGITAVRFPFDWSRLQPRPGRLDDDWREFYSDVLDAGAALGIDVWACLFEGVQPSWFDDDGGFADARAAGRWWPAWIESAAEAFGDRVAGWVPFDDPVGHAERAAGADSLRHQATVHHLLVAWRDAWRILRGGPPVATSLRLGIVRPADDTAPAREAARLQDRLRWNVWLRGLRDGTSSVPGRVERTVPDLAGALDVLGISVVADLGDDERADDGALARFEDRAGGILRRAAEEGPSRPIAVTFRPARDDVDERRGVLEAFGRATRDAIGDGVAISSVFASPAIAGPGGPDALIDRDRQPTSCVEAWLAAATR
ncbi:MAG: family 1 glycosylhydrolase [Acidimicrobiia bacterium]